ncbi:MAG: nuclear transport factor 2 family protein [Puia sp.]
MSKEVKLPAVIEKFIAATNGHQGDTFISCFAEDAYVNDAARSFRGKEQIKNGATRR